MRRAAGRATQRIGIAVAGLACGLMPLAPREASADVAPLRELMTGSFSSAAQATADTAFHDIRLEMVPIWTERGDGVWLYVEQAAASRLDRPYRQRVYRVAEPEPGRFVSEVWELPEPLRFAGAFREPGRLDALSPDSLKLREGCAVYLERRADGTFAGSTRGAECTSSLRGAAYATSEVVIGPEGLTSWDRGFDAEGEQVWGAEKGPYVFRRIDEEGPSPAGASASEATETDRKGKE